MLASLASLLLLASSTLAVSITDISGWTSTGPNEIKFSVVSTDPTSWEVLLVNQNTSLLSSSVVLVTDQSASAGSLTVSPACGSSLTSYPVGSGFQINFINSTSNAIVTQSNQFNITQGTGTATCASSTAAASQTSGSASAGASKASTAAASASSTAKTGAAFSITSSLGTSAAFLVALGVVGTALL